MGKMTKHAERRVRLFRNGSNQAVRIPREFEIEGSEAVMRKEGDTLIIQAIKKQGLVELLATMTPLEIDFPDVDEGLLALDDPHL